MSRIVRSIGLFAVLAALIAGSMASVSASHNGNNRATFGGTTSGHAIVNYSEGQGTFNGTATVRGL
jgi:hypothetical protein